MIATVVLLALTASLPAENSEFALSNVRLTYGLLGPVRPNGNLLPGDSLVVGFDIQGIKVDDAGKVRYSTSLDLVDSTGKVLFHQAPKDQETINSLGGNALPAFAQVDIGLEQPPGQYTLKVTVTDLAARKSKDLEHKFSVLPKAFGVVRLSTSADADGQHPVAALGVGQSLWLNGAAVGFKREKASGQPNLTFELSVIDEQGQAVLKKPFNGSVLKDVPAKASSVPFQYFLSLNRSGKFAIRLKAIDQISGETYSEHYPLTVLPAGK